MGLEPALLRALDDDALSSPQSSRPFPGKRPKRLPGGVESPRHPRSPRDALRRTELSRAGGLVTPDRPDLADLLLDSSVPVSELPSHHHEHPVRPHGRRGDSRDGSQKSRTTVESVIGADVVDFRIAQFDACAGSQKSQPCVCANRCLTSNRSGLLRHCASHRLGGPEPRSPWAGIRWFLSRPQRGQPRHGRCPRRPG
jgi:hypothetical protein